MEFECGGYWTKKWSLKLNGKYVVLGVAAIWDNRKGLEDFIKLRKMLNDDYEIRSFFKVSDENPFYAYDAPTITIDVKPKKDENMIGITRTDNVNELRELYALADVFLNPTYEDNFPTTNIEALSSGTPIITYRTGGSPEAMDKKSGIVIPKGNIVSIENVLQQMKRLSLIDSVRRSQQFNKEDKALEYVELYEESCEEIYGQETIKNTIC